MDIYCPKCGEPWDHDELHAIAGLPYEQASKEFRRVGCEVFDTNHNDPPDTDKAETAATVYDVLGDDLDGASSEFFDLGGEG